MPGSAITMSCWSLFRRALLNGRRRPFLQSSRGWGWIVVRKPKRLLVPYLADSYVVEGVSVVLGLAAFFGSLLLRDTANLPGGQSFSVALSIIIGLLTTMTAQQFLDRAIARSRTGRLEKLERALSDKNVFEYMVKVADSYKDATANMRDSAHAFLYREVVEDLLQAKDWENLGSKRLEIRDAVRELTIAKELLPTATTQVRAIALPTDLEYLQSEGGAEYLAEQESRIRTDRLIVQRLFVYSTRAAQLQNITLDSIEVDIRKVGDRHCAAGVECRMLNTDGVFAVPEVPDINIYDDHTVRFSTLQLGEGQMQSIVSEDRYDLRFYSQRFTSLWSLATPLAPGGRLSP